MLQNIKNLKGVIVLNKAEQKSINGGTISFGSDTCKATCKDGAIITVASCDTTSANLGCSQNGGSQSCTCGLKGPFDPPGIGYDPPHLSPHW